MSPGCLQRDSKQAQEKEERARGDLPKMQSNQQATKLDSEALLGSNLIFKLCKDKQNHCLLPYILRSKVSLDLTVLTKT